MRVTKKENEVPEISIFAKSLHQGAESKNVVKDFLVTLIEKTRLTPY